VVGVFGAAGPGSVVFVVGEDAHSPAVVSHNQLSYLVWVPGDSIAAVFEGHNDLLAFLSSLRAHVVLQLLQIGCEIHYPNFSVDSIIVPECDYGGVV
jgi:hypothetical protein